VKAFVRKEIYGSQRQKVVHAIGSTGLDSMASLFLVEMAKGVSLHEAKWCFYRPLLLFTKPQVDGLF